MRRVLAVSVERNLKAIVAMDSCRRGIVLSRGGPWWINVRCAAAFAW